MGKRVPLGPDDTAPDFANSMQDRTQHPNAPHRFKPGQSGNPAGRKPGSRNKAYQALEEIGRAGSHKILKAVVRAAAAGDMRAAGIILARCWPERKGAPIEVTLPKVKTPADIIAALICITEQVATGNITTNEAEELAAVYEGMRKAFELIDVQSRIEKLERDMNERG